MGGDGLKNWNEKEFEIKLVNWNWMRLLCFSELMEIGGWVWHGMVRLQY